MLNCIRIQGFKCFQEAEIRFSNFTLLAGKNSTGKSTVIQAILALYQNSASSLAGKYMNIGSVNEVKNWIAGSKKYLWRRCMSIWEGIAHTAKFLKMSMRKESERNFRMK
jgi:Uncharacterized conserved protein